MTTIDVPPGSQRRVHHHRPRSAQRSRTPFLRRVLTLPGSDTSLFWWLLSVVAVLNIIGLVMVLSASSVISLNQTGSSWTYFRKQVEFAFVGLLCAAGLVHLPTARIRRFGLAALGLCIVGLLAVHVPGLGVTANGATRWIGVGPIQIQPSEIVKLVVVVVTADWLDRNGAYLQVSRVSIRPVMLGLGVVAALVMAQPNLGTTIVIAVIVFSVLYAAGVPRAPLAGWGLLGAVAAVLLAFGSSYRRARMLSFLNPWADPQHNGYQLIQSQVGLAGGGLFGVGLGSSRAKWGFLPFAHTDFIFAIIGEELGLVGAAAVVGLFIGFGVLGIRIALRAEHRFDAWLAVGITTWIVVQAFVNIGAVVGILPITGVPLPFISYGGTSLMITLAAVGLLLNVARHPAPDRTAR